MAGKCVCVKLHFVINESPEKDVPPMVDAVNIVEMLQNEGVEITGIKMVETTTFEIR